MAEAAGLEARIHRRVPIGRVVFEAVLPRPLIVGPRHLAQVTFTFREL